MEVSYLKLLFFNIQAVAMLQVKLWQDGDVFLCPTPPAVAMPQAQLRQPRAVPPFSTPTPWRQDQDMFPCFQHHQWCGGKMGTYFLVSNITSGSNATAAIVARLGAIPPTVSILHHQHHLPPNDGSPFPP